jgi:hypothetical protein
VQLDLKNLLPQLLPRVIAWAEATAADAAANGSPLEDADLSIANTVGVQHPSLIRVQMVDQLPLPGDLELKAAALQAGLLGPEMTGFTLGHSILICNGHLSRRLLSHECRHVHQYERAGSIAGFIQKYLESIVEFGYSNSPFEQDARAHELIDV